MKKIMLALALASAALPLTACSTIGNQTPGGQVEDWRTKASGTLQDLDTAIAAARLGLAIANASGLLGVDDVETANAALDAAVIALTSARVALEASDEATFAAALVNAINAVKELVALVR